MNDIEDRVRRALRTDVGGVDTVPLLAEIHRGATRRRRRRAVAALAASVLLIAGTASVATTIREDGRPAPDPTPLTQTPSPSPSPSQPALPEGATQGVMDVSVVSTDRWFRLTTNVGCVACSTVWQNDGQAGDGWTRLYDFEGTTDDYGGEVDPSYGPVDSFVMSVNGEDGWAWGSRLRVTHDGGHTWNVLTTGPAHGEGGSFEVSTTDEDVWALRRTRAGRTELWRAPLSSDDWSRADAPDMGNVIRMFTLADQVALETSDAGVPRLHVQHSADGVSWSDLANPCTGESQISAARSAVFILCPPAGGSSALYRADELASWKLFGHVTPGGAHAVLALGDDRVLIDTGRATGKIVTQDATTQTALGLDPGEAPNDVSTSGSTSFLATSLNRLVESTDAGATWHPVP
jgi:hypothetical protein